MERTYQINVRDVNLTLTDHAIQRFQERTGSKSVDNAIASIVKMLGKEYNKYVKPARRNSVSILIKHGFKDTIFINSNGFIFVIEEGNVIKTCYPANKGDWVEEKYPSFVVWEK